MWCVAALDEEYIARMEDVLAAGANSRVNFRRTSFTTSGTRCMLTAASRVLFRAASLTTKTAIDIRKRSANAWQILAGR